MTGNTLISELEELLSVAGLSKDETSNGDVNYYFLSGG